MSRPQSSGRSRHHQPSRAVWRMLGECHLPRASLASPVALGTDERVRGATVVVAAEGVGHVAERQCGQMGKWANGQMGKWANGQMGKWANGQCGQAAKRPSGQAVKRSSGQADAQLPARRWPGWMVSASADRFSLRRGGNLVNRQVRAVVFVLLVEPQTHRQANHPVYERAAERRHHDAAQRADQLRSERHTAQAA